VTQTQVTPVKAPRLPSGTEITLEDPQTVELGNVTLALQKE
jgi:hypothetical protein